MIEKLVPMKTITDQQLFDIALLIREVMRENSHQLGKWGIQTRTPFEWINYLTEEVGELAEAISNDYYPEMGDKHAVFKEAIQVATLALKIAEMYYNETGRDTQRDTK